jgi:hypothetical protein
MESEYKMRESSRRKIEEMLIEGTSTGQMKKNRNFALFNTTLAIFI